MAIWVNADVCQKVIKEFLFRAADRAAVQVTLVANRLLYSPSSPYISPIQVADGFDVADSEIVTRLEAGDLVITADIPLAAEVIAIRVGMRLIHGVKCILPIPSKPSGS